MLVKVAKYEVDNHIKSFIIERDNNKYPYKEVILTFIDYIVDRAKEFIFHPVEFNGYNGISKLYRFNTEDSACVFHDNQDIINNNTVATVTGSGDAILDLFLYGAKKIVSFDINILTTFYGELKFIVAKYLTFDEFDYYFGSNLSEDIYRKFAQYLSANTYEFWNKIYSYLNTTGKKIDDLFHSHIVPLFAFNGTLFNKKGYYNEQNYLKLQQILKDKTIDDINFVNCDLFQLPNKVDLSGCSYIYLSNIMDFIVGVFDDEISVEKLDIFKKFVLTKLLPALSENSNIDLSYIKTNWHYGVNPNQYLDVYTLNEGFIMNDLSNREDKLLSFRSSLLIKDNKRKY